MQDGSTASGSIAALRGRPHARALKLLLLHPWAALLAAAALVGGIGVLDLLTGVDIRIYPLYFIPIALAARFGPGRTAWVIPALSTIAWLSSNLAADAMGWAPSTWAINTGTQAIAFFTVGLLIRQVHEHLELERGLSRRDPLTQLPNHRAFHEQGQRMITGAARSGLPIALAYLDLDNFKLVNDRHGHAEGDRVLQRVAEVLRAELRVSDLPARLGGDEFAALLYDADPEGASASLERVHAELNRAMNAEGWPVTVSVGAVCFRRAPNELREAIEQADQLMYGAKRDGKNRVVIHELPSAGC